MKKKLITSTLILCIFTLNIPSVYASDARILTDQELDQVHAGGLNFDFNKFLSVLPADPNRITSDILTEAFRVSYNPNTQTENKNVTILSSPQKPKSPSASTTSPESTNATQITTTPSAVEITPATILNGAIDSLSTLESNRNINETPGTVVPNTASTAVTTPAGISTPTMPGTSSIQTPIQLDILAGTTGDIITEISSIDPTDIIPDEILPDTGDLSNMIDSSSNNTLNNSGTANIVEVSDSSQQFLSALVNVNAAGSSVPVTINLTIVVNSTVESISNSNQVTLQNLHTYNF